MSIRHLFALSLLSFAPLVQAGGIAESVGISGFSYTPANVTVQVGETVAFAASGFHPLGLDDSVVIQCNVDCNVTYLRGGTYGFYCLNHGGPGGSGMSGTVTVQPDDGWVFAGTFEHTLD